MCSFGFVVSVCFVGSVDLVCFVCSIKLALFHLLVCSILFLRLVLSDIFVYFIWFVGSVGPIGLAGSVDSADQAKTNNNRTKTFIMMFHKGNNGWPMFFCVEIFVFICSVCPVCSVDLVGSVVVLQEIIPGPEQPRVNV